MVPCALTTRERQALRRHACNKRAIEAGALLGGSTIELAQTALHVVSIDKHMGYSAPTERQFRSNLQRYGVSHKVLPVVANAMDALLHCSGDVGFIDLDGTYKTTLTAIQRINTPLVMIHDLTRIRCGGVERAIRAAGLEIVEHIDTLAVCWKRS